MSPTLLVTVLSLVTCFSLHAHELAVVAVRVQEGGDDSTPVLGSFLADEGHAGRLEALALRLYVVDPKVDQRALRLLGRAFGLAVAVDDERRAVADRERTVADL